jgi:co-chaperonin GroES (HSP10)
MPFKPNVGRCAVTKIEQTITPGGIHVVGNKNETVISGRVVSLGLAEKDQEIDVAVGDTVFFQQYHETGMTVEIDNVKLVVLRYADILGSV